jgi:hypothetical protein
MTHRSCRFDELNLTGWMVAWLIVFSGMTSWAQQVVTTDQDTPAAAYCGKLGIDKNWENSWFCIGSGVAGPTVMVVGLR